MSPEAATPKGSRDKLPVRSITGRSIIIVVLAALLLASCSQNVPDSGTATVSGAHLPAGLQVTSANASPARGFTALSGVVRVAPSGPLESTAIIHIDLDHSVPNGDAVVVRISELVHGPWSLLAATLSADRQAVDVDTMHFSFFQALGFDVDAAAATFKSDFLDGLDGGATMSVVQPSCQGDATARTDGYSITSSTTDTVYSCFGMNGSDRVLKVTDDRRYPLEVFHPGLTVSQGGSIDWGQLSSLSHFGSGRDTIIAPGDTVTGLFRRQAPVEPQVTGIAVGETYLRLIRAA
jgi:hypothetical protein